MATYSLVRSQVSTRSLARPSPSATFTQIRGLFIAADLDDAQSRLSSWQISPTGPIFGAEMRWPERDALELERALWDAQGMQPEMLQRLRKWMPGSRRVARIRPADVHVLPFDDGIELAFTLPKGAYATVVLRELLKSDAVDASDPDSDSEAVSATSAGAAC